MKAIYLLTSRSSDNCSQLLNDHEEVESNGQTHAMLGPFQCRALLLAVQVYKLQVLIISYTRPATLLACNCVARGFGYARLVK